MIGQLTKEQLLQKRKSVELQLQKYQVIKNQNLQRIRDDESSKQLSIKSMPVRPLFTLYQNQLNRQPPKGIALENPIKIPSKTDLSRSQDSPRISDNGVKEQIYNEEQREMINESKSNESQSEDQRDEQILEDENIQDINPSNVTNQVGEQQQSLIKEQDKKFASVTSDLQQYNSHVQSVQEEIIDNPFNQSYKESSLFFMSQTQDHQFESQLKVHKKSTVVKEQSKPDDFIEESLRVSEHLSEYDDINKQEDPIKSSPQQPQGDIVESEEVQLLQTLKESSELKDISHMQSVQQQFNQTGGLISFESNEQSIRTLKDREDTQQFQSVDRSKEDIEEICQDPLEDDQQNNQFQETFQKTEDFNELDNDQEDIKHPKMIEFEGEDYSSNQEKLYSSEAPLEKVPECQSDHYTSPIQSIQNDSNNQNPQLFSIHINYTDEKVILEQDESQNETIPIQEENFRATFQSIQRKLTQELYVGVDEIGKVSMLVSINQEKMQQLAMQYVIYKQQQMLKHMARDFNLLYVIISKLSQQTQLLQKKVFQALKDNLLKQRLKNYQNTLVRKMRHKNNEKWKRNIFFELLYNYEKNYKLESKIMKFMYFSRLKTLWNQWKIFTYVTKANRQMDMFYKNTLFTGWKKATKKSIEMRKKKLRYFMLKKYVKKSFKGWKKYHQQKMVKKELNDLFKEKHLLNLKFKYFTIIKNYAEDSLKSKNYNYKDVIAIKIPLGSQQTILK